MSGLLDDFTHNKYSNPTCTLFNVIILCMIMMDHIYSLNNNITYHQTHTQTFKKGGVIHCAYMGAKCGIDILRGVQGNTPGKHMRCTDILAVRKVNTEGCNRACKVIKCSENLVQPRYLNSWTKFSQLIMVGILGTLDTFSSSRSCRFETKSR